MRWVNVFAAFYSNFTCYFLLKLQLAFISLHRLSSWTSSRHPQTCLTNPFSSLWVWRFSLSFFFFICLPWINPACGRNSTLSAFLIFISYNRSLFQVCDSRSLRTDAVIGEFKVRALTWVYDFYEYWTAVYCDKLGGGARVLWKLEELKHLSLCSVFHRWMWAPSTMSTVSIWLFDLNIFRCICLKKFKQRSKC